MPDTETPAALLRRAAETLREMAGKATPGPWWQHDTHLGQYGHTATVLSGEGNAAELRAWLPSMEHEPWDERRNVWADAAYIAAMHPGVGLALAEVLERQAFAAEMSVVPLTGAEPWLRPSLALARRLLGEVAE